MKYISQLSIYLFLWGVMGSCALFRAVPDYPQTSPTVTDNSNSTNFLPMQNKPMTGESKVLENGDSLQVMVGLDIPRLAQEKDRLNLLLQDFTVQYGILPAYNSPQYTETAVVKLDTKNLAYENEMFYLHFNAPKRQGTNAVMILEIVDKKSGEKVKLDLLLPYVILKMREKMGVFDKTGKLPYFTNYLHTRDTLQVRDLLNSSQKLYVRYYRQAFEPASPPMIAGDKLPSKLMKSDSTFMLDTNKPFQFKTAGLYLLLVDTTQYYGLGLRVVDRKYPKLSYVKDVIEPLRYLTTDDEFLQLRNGENTKDELDKLWLRLMGNNVPLAQKTIREYYNRVKLANRYFTSYKEGWKTDMGMIFVVYGRPSRIIRTNDMEFWFYNPSAINPTEIRFTFTKKPNQFTDEAYGLVRQPVYENVWYPVIELWRTGKAF